MKSLLRSRKLWFLAIPITLILVIWFGYSAFMEYFTYHPEVDYQVILQSSPGYDFAENVNVSFSYEPAESPALTKLRQTYGLDKVAGSGTDMEKAKNLLKWVHDMIPHDGNRSLPQQRDAISLINNAKRAGRGINCRGLAIILEESLLSVGIKARYVELLPRDFSTDSHVITLAYITELGKWVFLDPTYQAYFTNADGEPLGAGKIRASLIAGGALIVNPESNYNGGSMDVDYLNYLAKNMYRFASPEYSAFGIDSSPERKMVILGPTGDDSGRRNPFEQQITLHNPEIFWATPKQ